MKVKNLGSKNTKIKLQIMKEILKKRVLKITVKNHRLLKKISLQGSFKNSD